MRAVVIDLRKGAETGWMGDAGRGWMVVGGMGLQRDVGRCLREVVRAPLR